MQLYIAETPTGTLGTYLNLTIDYAPDADAYGSCATFRSPPTPVYNGTLAALRHRARRGRHPRDDLEPRRWPGDPYLPLRISVQDNVAARGLTSTGFSWETRTS